MLRAIRLEGQAVRAGGREVCEPGAALWIDLSPDPDDLAWLGQRFGFHPLALEDCAHADQRTKFEEYPEALFAVIHRLAPTPDDTSVEGIELHAFLASQALVTVHQAPIAELDRIFERCAAEPALLDRGPDFALYLVYDAVTDVHFDLADALTDEIEELATEVVEGVGSRDLTTRILAARRTHAVMRRRLAPQREVFAALARPGPAEPRVNPKTAPYFRDVLDHLLRVTEEIDVGRDMLGSVMDAHLSMVNNRLTLVTTRLTVVAGIFLPLNFIAGFFGMNLEIFPAPWGKWIAVGSLLVLPTVLWLLARRKRLL